jgi:hypothetical protein
MDAIEDLRQLEEINRQLIEANLKLIEQVEMLTHNLAALQDNQSHEICTYFLEHNSIHDVAKEYYFNCDLDCYYALVEYFGCSDPLTTATDYKNVLMGQEEGIDDEIDDEIDVNTHIKN